MSGSMPARRPGGITFLMVLGVIAGIANIIAGIFVIIDREDSKLIEAAKMSKDELAGTGVGMIIAGAILLLLAIMLGRGSNVVRWLYGIVAALNAGFGLYAVISFHSEQRLAGVMTLSWSLLVLWLLFGSQRDQEFFESH